MLNSGFADWPSFTQEEADAVSRVLLSNRVNYWTGQEGRAFEKEFADFVGTRHAIAVANGTVALDLALAGLGIGAAYGGSASDEVVVTPRTFLASVSSVVSAGAVPVFADVDRNSGNLSAATIEPVLTGRTRAIIPVHLAGMPCDMDPIMDLAARHNLKVIEDCAQAHGAVYKGRSVGSIGHVGAWSFCQDKIMTTGGEGGMVTTNDPALWSKMWSYKDHGKSWEAVYERSHPPGFRWLHEHFGTNWRLTEMQSVLGRIQLKRMAEWHAARQSNANAIQAALQPFAAQGGCIRLVAPAHAETDDDAPSQHANYKFYAYVEPANLADSWTRDRIVNEITARGVPCFQGSCSEVYLEKAFDGTGRRPATPLPVAQELGRTSIMFLVHPTLTDQDIAKTRAAITEVLTLAAKAK